MNPKASTTILTPLDMIKIELAQTKLQLFDLRVSTMRQDHVRELHAALTAAGLDPDKKYALDTQALTATLQD